MSAGGQRKRVDSIGPVLTFTDSVVSLVEGSFRLVSAEKSPGGYTVYKVQFKVHTETPQGQPIIEECESWKRFSDFQNLARQFEQFDFQQQLPALVKANYFDRFKESVIEERRQSAELFLQFASQQLHLSTSAPLINFMKGASIVRILPISDLSLSEEMDTPTGSGNNIITGSNMERGSGNIGVGSDVDRGSGNIGIGSGDVRLSLLLDNSEDEVTSDISMATSDGVIRSNSVTVSQWGLEHALKLREEEPSEGSGSKPSQLTLIVEDEDEEGPAKTDLPLPSTPKTGEASLIRKPQATDLGGSDWWTQALAQSNVINTEDYDSLIDNITETSKDCVTVVDKDITEKDGLKMGSQRSPSISPHKSGGERRTSIPNDGAYIVQAGKLITQGLEYEKLGQVEEAFDLFKAGVDVLLNGVQTDVKVLRREAVRLKTAEYLQYAEILQRKLVKKKQKVELSKMEAAGNAKPHLLQDFKLISIIASKVMLVESKHTSQRFIFKVLHKQLSPEEKKQYQGRIPRSKNRTPSQCPYMVKLLHHYETQSNRIFLLLEWVKNGQLLKHVQSIREHHSERRRKKRRKAKSIRDKPEIHTEELNQQISIPSGVTIEVTEETESFKYNLSPSPEASKNNLSPSPEASKNNLTPSPIDDDDNEYMENLLKQLTGLSAPPSNVPVSSLTSTVSQGTEESDEEEEDQLATLRKQIEALDSNDNDDKVVAEMEQDSSNNEVITIANTDIANTDIANTDIANTDGIADTEITDDYEVLTVGESDNLMELERQLIAFTSAMPDEEPLSNNSDDVTEEKEDDTAKELDITTVMSTSTTGMTTNTASTTANISTTTSTEDTNTSSTNSTTGMTTGISTDTKEISTADPVPPLTDVAASINIVPPTPTTPLSEPLPISSSSEPVPVHSSRVKSELPKETKKSSGQTTPQFSPVVSLRNSPEPTSLVPMEEWEIKLENDIKKWAAQLVIAIEHLHHNEVVCKDIQPENVLLDDSGGIKLTYFGKWDHVPYTTSVKAINELYAAPELEGLGDVTASSDWWSLGAMLFELLTGKQLIDCHPGGVDTHIPLVIPGKVSPEGKSFLQQLLQVSPLERIGSGLNGIDDIKSHPFFHSINWNELYQQ